MKKIVSGAHHTLALTHDGKIFSWGSDDNGKIGRIIKSRDRYQQAMKITALGVKSAVDIFAGKNHSFFINQKGQLHAWGKNANGQLGIGTLTDTHLPTLIKELKNVRIVCADGGENHSIALDDQGKVYCFGLNDEG